MTPDEPQEDRTEPGEAPGAPETQEPREAPASAEPPVEEEPPEDFELADDADQPDDPSGSRPEQQLQAILETAKTGRLAPGEEERAIDLLKQTIPGGPKALPATIDALLTLPWNASVKAATDAWPATKPAGRARLATGLAKADSDSSRRIRLSLARGLHAQDAAVALKLISSVCEAMGGAQGGSTTKDRQIFANVMLGKARPWLMNIAMADMKPADALKLIIPALESCQQAPIFTQIWVLRWVCDAGKFDALTPEHIESIGKVVSRWQSRWQKELRKLIPALPESLEAAIAAAGGRAGGHAPAPAPAAPARPEAAEEDPEPPDDDEEDDEEDEPDEEIDSGETRSPAPPPRAQEQRRSGRDRQQQGGPFDLNRSLREIESYVARLRSELQQAQATARRREPGGERSRGRGQQAPAGSPEEIDELRRHNQQIEEQNLELRSRIEELLADHEDRAATLEISDSLEQFKKFLGLKLKEDFADYNAISRESLNEVVRRHAHEILGRIFAVLRAEGVKFDAEK
jgi:hypothetical protein